MKTDGRTYHELLADTQASYEDVLDARRMLKEAQEAFADDIDECNRRGIQVNLHG